LRRGCVRCDAADGVRSGSAKIPLNLLRKLPIDAQPGKTSLDGAGELARGLRRNFLSHAGITKAGDGKKRLLTPREF
jgi:hypothetical protein